MGKRKLTFQQQLVAFCMTANAEQVEAAYDTLRAARDILKPATKPTRARRSDAGTKRNKQTPPAPDAAAVAAAE